MAQLAADVGKTFGSGSGGYGGLERPTLRFSWVRLIQLLG